MVDDDDDSCSSKLMQFSIIPLSGNLVCFFLEGAKGITITTNSKLSSEIWYGVGCGVSHRHFWPCHFMRGYKQYIYIYIILMLEETSEETGSTYVLEYYDFLLYIIIDR